MGLNLWFSIGRHRAMFPYVPGMVNRHLTSAGSPQRTASSWSR